MGRACDHGLRNLEPPNMAGDCWEDWLAEGRRDSAHVRFCQTCGQVGCGDDSAGRYATAHIRETARPLVRSFEPREDPWRRRADGAGLRVGGAPR